jgi:Mg2+ and Co2+ transporter CorA
MSQVQIQINEKTKKLLRLAKVSARLARDRERYREALRTLARSMPKEVRSTIARYNVVLRKTIVEPTPENLRILGELAVEKAKELKSWRAEAKTEREIASKIAQQFYQSLSEVTELAKQLSEEFSEELTTAEVE